MTSKSILALMTSTKHEPASAVNGTGGSDSDSDSGSSDDDNNDAVSVSSDIYNNVYKALLFPTTTSSGIQNFKTELDQYEFETRIGLQIYQTFTALDRSEFLEFFKRLYSISSSDTKLDLLPKSVTSIRSAFSSTLGFFKISIDAKLNETHGGLDFDSDHSFSEWLLNECIAWLAFTLSSDSSNSSKHEKLFVINRLDPTSEVTVRDLERHHVKIGKGPPSTLGTKRSAYKTVNDFLTEAKFQKYILAQKEKLKNKRLKYNAKMSRLAADHYTPKKRELERCIFRNVKQALGLGLGLGSQNQQGLNGQTQFSFACELPNSFVTNDDKKKDLNADTLDHPHMLVELKLLKRIEYDAENNENQYDCIWKLSNVCDVGHSLVATTSISLRTFKIGDFTCHYFSINVKRP